MLSHARRSACFVLLLAATCWSQTNFGRISGSVQDSTGASVPGSSVTVTSPATGQKIKVETDSAGLFVFPSLPAGTYNVRVEHEGFKSAEQNGVILDAASSRDLIFRLDVGQLSESVSVSATAEQVQTTSGNIGRVISEQQVSQIALNGREYTQLLRLVPGVVATTLNVFNPQLALDQQRVNGIRTQSSYFMVDGAENHDNGANSNGLVDPNVDAIAEVKLDTSSYAAEFGGRAGATINLVTKSGTREFHGTLFEFVRNDAFDARSFFAAKVDPLRFNDFGGTVGGPVFIPGKFNRNKDKLLLLLQRRMEIHPAGTELCQPGAHGPRTRGRLPRIDTCRAHRPHHRTGVSRSSGACVTMVKERAALTQTLSPAELPRAGR